MTSQLTRADAPVMNEAGNPVQHHKHETQSDVCGKHACWTGQGPALAQPEFGKPQAFILGGDGEYEQVVIQKVDDATARHDVRQVVGVVCWPYSPAHLQAPRRV